MVSDITTACVQRVLKDLLCEFVRICEKYNLRYYLIDGSLLGAVRHSGFIPWDDDIDVGMPRPDYEKLCDIIRNELPDNMYFVSYEESLKEGSVAEIARMYCSNLKLKMDYFGNDQTSDAWMDIMIMYGMPENNLFRKLYYKKYFFIKGLARMGRIEHIGSRHYNLIEKAFIHIAKLFDLSKLISTEKLLLWGVKVLKKHPYDNSKYVIVVPSEYGPNEIVPTEYYEPGRIVQFEDLRVRVPTQCEKVLEKLYGDYMTPPPPEKRVSKHKVTIVEE